MNGRGAGRVTFGLLPTLRGVLHCTQADAHRRRIQGVGRMPA
ncbi:hypothetical protein LF41_1110 [Lysobacter dokdonensis DS-58]|uniref:Uncharacterized protein n=1 Tax=Lysobacter dokdonensis DS-58 TaxID=1300345 RepID=A0A0A2WLA3_9GAMM|nr:hypothetical protein LF41_1110 [Lysobacter dokdonensis DS-58]